MLGISYSFDDFEADIKKYIDGINSSDHSDAAYTKVFNKMFDRFAEADESKAVLSDDVLKGKIKGDFREAIKRLEEALKDKYEISNGKKPVPVVTQQENKENTLPSNISENGKGAKEEQSSRGAKLPSWTNGTKKPGIITSEIKEQKEKLGVIEKVHKNAITEEGKKGKEEGSDNAPKPQGPK